MGFNRVTCGQSRQPHTAATQNLQDVNQKVFVLPTRKIDEKKNYMPNKKTASLNFLDEVTGAKYGDISEGIIQQWPPYVLNHVTKNEIFEKE